MWHFIVEEYPRHPHSFKDLTEFQKERRQVVSLFLIQESIDYSLFHNIVEVDTPKRASDTLKEFLSEEPTLEEDDFVSQTEVLSEEPTVEEDDFVSQAEHQNPTPKWKTVKMTVSMR